MRPYAGHEPRPHLLKTPLGEIETSCLALRRKWPAKEVTSEERKEKDTAKRQMVLEKDIGSLEGRLYGGATEEESATAVFHELYEQTEGDEGRPSCRSTPSSEWAPTRMCLPPSRIHARPFSFVSCQELH